MNKRRLLKLADLLEADAKNKKGIQFDIGTIGQPSDFREQFKPGLNCGTTACAMGLAAISGAFNHGAIRLSFKVSEYDIDTTINGRRHVYYVAASKAFDISEGAARFLFSTSFYDDYANKHGELPTGARGERYVAKRIRDFVAGKMGPEL